MMCTIGLFSAMMLLFYAGYVTGKELERDKFEKRVKRGFVEVGNMIYFCAAPNLAIITHVRDATSEEVESAKRNTRKEESNENSLRDQAGSNLDCTRV